MRWDMSLAIERDKCVKAVNNKEAGQVSMCDQTFTDV